MKRNRPAVENTMLRGASNKALLVDRDGVLNRNIDSYVRHVDSLEVLPAAVLALRLATLAGYRVLVVTNQAGVSKGLLTHATLDAIHQKLRAEVAVGGGCIDAFYVCPHVAEAMCDCRKPRPGLIYQAQREWGFALTHTWLVGDSLRDLQAARAAGCKPAMVRTGLGDFSAAMAQDAALADVPVFDDLLVAVRAMIVSHDCEQ